jgi:uncharacterized protein YbjT (DUF2867 family)
VKIVIPGGSGQVGTLLRHALVADGHEVVVLSRDPKPGEVHWDGENLGTSSRAHYATAGGSVSVCLRTA